MRPVRLSFSMFGPYEKETVIDFSALRGRSFFLIHGATGAGKTTILDAICFSLYGDASGEKREARMLRSEQADVHQATWAEFVFELGSRCYQVWRSPEQELAKKRGNGTTMRHAEAVLYEVRDEKVLVAEGYANVTAAIEELLGFKSSQFRQVVLLPQGEFRRLLLANSSERQAIMEVLFKTEVYRQLEEGLKTRARGIEEKHKEAGQAFDLLLADEAVETSEAFVAQITAKKEKVRQLQRVTAVRKQEQEKAQQAVQAGRLAEHQFQILQAARQEMADCQSKVEALTKYKQEWERAEQAAALADLAHQVQQAADDCAVRNRQHKQAQQAQQSLEQQYRQVKEQAARIREKEPERLAAEQRQRKLGEYRTLAAAVTAAVGEAAQGEKMASLAARSLQQAEEKLQSLQQLLTDSQAKEKELTVLAGAEKAAQLELKAMEEQKKAINAAVQYRAAWEQARIHEQAASQAAVQAGEDWQAQQRVLERLQHLFAEGQAAVLAAGLQPGAPCPVCGSTEHPVPAIPQQMIPDETELRQARQKLQKLDQLRQQALQKQLEAGRTAAAAHSRCEQGGQQSDESPKTVEELESAILSLHKTIQAAVAAGAHLTEVQKHIAQLQMDITAAGKMLEQARCRKSEADAQSHTALGILQEKRETLPAEYRERPDRLAADEKQAGVQAARMQEEKSRAEAEEKDMATRLASAKAAAEAAARVREESQQRSRQQAAEFAGRREEAGFSTMEEWQEAVSGKWIQADYRDKVRQHIRVFEDRCTAAEAALQRAEAATHDLLMPQMDLLGAALVQADTAWNESYAEEQKLAAEIKRDEAKAQKLAALTEQAEHIEREYRIVGRLSDVANGKNVHGITFQRYVLRSLLRDVIDAANARLLVMSRGQYQLQPTNERARKNAAGGLDMEVFDEYTGYARPMATLSGGESFLASLSLALGLADVVQSYAGGIHLDTIFIDEGFGTLDTETLDMALKALLELQQGGRLVGIISHVEELAERIDARLEITKTREGSTANFIVG